MPHAALRITSGVNLVETPALNETGIASCNLIRYSPGPTDGVLSVQKLGGWTRYFQNTMPAKVRALWAWEDTESNSYLAYGTEEIGATFQSQLGVISGGSSLNITPRAGTDNVTPTAASTAGSSIVTITDATTTNITKYDAVYIPTHLSIGGVILFGLYACNPDGHSATTTYTVQAVDKLGSPLAAASTSSSPVVALFTTTSGQSSVTVTLPNHGYAVGDTYPVLVKTSVGGITFYSHYPVQSVIDADNFTITGDTNASASTSGYINAGKVRFIYSFGVGAIPAGSGFGIGGFGRGGFGVGTGIAPSLGSPIGATDWTLDNWGELLIACPSPAPLVFTTTGTSGTGATGTITFSETYTVPVGESVTVSGVSPATWNGFYVVTGSTSHSVSFATSLTSAQTGAGTITVNSTPFAPIYQWDAEAGAPTATVIPQAPPVNEGVFLAMPQRQLIAYGSTFTGIQDPLLIRWCDVNNFSVWLGTIANQAGQFRIPKGSRIVGAMQTPQQGLVWTDLGLWSMQYIGQPYIYSFNEIGSGCGLIAKKAAGTLHGSTYWMGPSQFFVLDGEGVEPVPCAVWDIAFQDLDTAYVANIRIAINSLFNEVAWYFPTTGSGGEPTNYVKYNAAVQQWDYGTLARSAWVDQSVLGPPIGADPSSLYLYQHETSPDADGQAMTPIFRTGYFALAEGDVMTFVDQLWPDAKYGTYGGMANATVNITVYGVDYPGDTPAAYGPFVFTQATQYASPRMRHRLFAMEWSSNDIGSFWRVGLPRYRYAPDGKF